MSLAHGVHTEPGNTNVISRSAFDGSIRYSIEDWCLPKSALQVHHDQPIPSSRNEDVFKGELKSGEISEPVAVRVVKAGADECQAIKEAMFQLSCVCQVAKQVGDGVLQVKGFVQAEDDELLIVMEPFEGDLLTHKGTWERDDAIAMARQVSRALSKLHAHGIVHGDISPSVIRILRPGVAALADIGFSHICHSVLQLPEPDPDRDIHYCPPEEVDPFSRAPNAKADVWRLAATILRLLTGEEPYAGRSVLQVAALLNRYIPPWLEVDRGGLVPSEVWPLLQKCFEHSPAKRPGAEALANVLSDLNAASAFMPGRDPDSSRPAKRLRSEAIVVFVKTMMQTTVVLHLDPDAMVRGLKNAVLDKNGIPLDQQRLIFAGSQLDDFTTLRECNVRNESTVHLVLRLKGC